MCNSVCVCVRTHTVVDLSVPAFVERAPMSLTVIAHVTDLYAVISHVIASTVEPCGQSARSRAEQSGGQSGGLERRAEKRRGEVRAYRGLNTCPERS